MFVETGSTLLAKGVVFNYYFSGSPSHSLLASTYRIDTARCSILIRSSGVSFQEGQESGVRRIKKTGRFSGEKPANQ